MVGLPNAGGGNRRGGLVGGGELRLPPSGHSRIVYFYQANNGPVSGGKTEAGARGGKEVVGTGRFGFGGDVDGGLGGGSDRGEGGSRQYRYRDRLLIKWGDTVANITLGLEPDSPLAYDLVLELQHLIMSMMGAHGGQLERGREAGMYKIP